MLLTIIITKETARFLIVTFKEKIKEKLFLKGFTNDVIDKAMAEYDFEYDLEKEKLALEKDYLKASHRYEKN